MRKIFLARPIRYSEVFRKYAYGLFLSAVFVLSLMFFLVLFARAADEAIDEPNEETVVAAPSKEVLDHVLEAVSQFQAAMPPNHFSEIKSRSDAIVKDKLCEAAVGAAGRPGCPGEHTSAYTGLDGQNKSSGNAVLARPGVDSGQEGQGNASIGSVGRRVYYFFSFSMPGESLQQAVRDADELRRQGKNVVMVIRGLVKNDLRATAAAFERLMRESGVDSNLPVDVDPPLYEQYGITEVPIIISASTEGTGKITGDVGIPYTLSKFDSKIEDYGRVGHTYEIAEEDLLKLIASKQPMIEAKLRQRIETLQDRMFILDKHDGHYSKAVKDRVYYVDPSLVLADNVYDHEGKVLYQKGSVFNPTDYVRLGRYIIIDGKDAKQVKMALEGDFRKVMIISGDLAKLSTTHRKRFWFAPGDVLKRLEIRRVPAIIEQEGRMIRVTEKAI